MDNLRRFVIVITIFLFFATSVCGFLLALGYSGISKEKETTIDIDADPYKPDDDQPTSFKGTILVIVGEKSRPETDVLFVVNYDSNHNQLSFLYIPKDLKYTDPIIKETNSIGSYYSKNSAEKTATLVSSILDINIPYYINLNDNAFARMINMFEAVNFNMPISIKYKDAYYDIDIKKNENVFDGTMALKLIQFYKTEDDTYTNTMLNYYNGKDTSRIRMASNFLNAFVSQKFGEQYKDQYFDLFKLLLPECETNITESVLRSMTAKLDKINHDISRSYMITGKETISTKYYIEFDNLFLDFTSGLNVSSRQVLDTRFVS